MGNEASDAGRTPEPDRGTGKGIREPFRSRKEK
jgi:hypothetical protein